MNRNTGRTIVGGAGLGWLGVGLYGVWEITGKEAGDGWERPYMLYSISLFVAAALTLVIGWEHTRGTDRAVLRRVGIGIGAIAVVSSLVAWALPLWMTLIGASFVILAIAAPRPQRLILAVLAAAQIFGMALMFIALFVEVGPQNSYGDYPVAFGLGLVATAGLTMLGLAGLARADPATTSHSQTSVGRPTQTAS